MPQSLSRHSERPPRGVEEGTVSGSLFPPKADAPPCAIQQPPIGSDDEESEGSKDPNFGTTHAQGLEGNDPLRPQVTCRLDDPEATGITISDNSMQRMVDGPYPKGVMLDESHLSEEDEAGFGWRPGSALSEDPGPNHDVLTHVTRPAQMMAQTSVKCLPHAGDP